MNKNSPHDIKKQEFFWWHHLRRPFFILAPMYDVTDTVFRRMIAHRSRPAVLMTEFVSADALVHPTGAMHVAHLLWHDPSERAHGARLVVQLFGAHPETMRRAAAFVATMGFDGIDLNMGCPEKNIQKQGSGAALIRTPDVAQALIAAVRAGIADAGMTMPVSVKTRIGYSTEIIDEWIPALLAARPDALTVHLRTKKEMSDVPAHWELMPRILSHRNALACHCQNVPCVCRPVIVGNGDIATMDAARHAAETTGCDGVMIGRGVFGNPWFFDGGTASSRARAEALYTHMVLYDTVFGGVKSFEIMKRHIKAYIHGYEGAAAHRAALMNTTTAQEACALLVTLIPQIPAEDVL